MPLPPVSRFLAYISYAVEDNQPPGRQWAEWVMDALETYPVPRQLAGRPTPLGPIPPRFAHLHQASRKSVDALTAETREALEHSRVLIVICSPAAARSAAVAEEVRHFKQVARRPVIALIIDGEPDSATAECYPDSLKFEVRADGTLDREWRLLPIAVDARPDGGPAPHRLAEARRLLAAAVLGVPPDALPPAPSKGGEMMERTAAPRRNTPILGWVTILALGGAGVLGWIAWQAREEAQAAIAARQRSDELIVFVQRNLREKLSAVGQLGALAEVNERITEHLSRVSRETNDPAALAGLADAFHDSAAILSSQGKHAPAMEAAQQAAQTRQRVVENPQAPAETPLLLIGDLRLGSEILLRMQQPAEALAVAEQARTLAAALTLRRLGDPEADLALAQTHGLAADASFALGRFPEAERAAESARETARKVAASAPANTAAQLEFATSTERIAKVKERQGDLSGASTAMAEWLRMLAAQAAVAPNDWKLQSTLAFAHSRMGNLHATQQKFGEAARDYRNALEVFDTIAQAQPADKEAQRKFVTAAHQLAAVLTRLPGSETEALTILRRALDHLDQHFPGTTDEAASQSRMEIERLQKALMSKPAGNAQKP